MHDWLANLYGTQANIEKNAAASAPAADGATAGEQVLMAKIAADLAEEQIDVDTLTEEEAAAVLDHYLSNLSEEDVAALEALDAEGATGADGEITAEAQAKLAEADTMGRTMAHAFYAELTDINKAAAAGASGGVNIKGFLEKGAAGGKGRIAKILAAAKKGAKKAWAHPAGKVGAGAAGMAALGGGGLALYKALQERKG